jgi:hypothetical protein
MKKGFITGFLIVTLCLSMLTVFIHTAASQSTSGPVISSVSPISATQVQTIEITGSRFGSTYPQTSSLGDGSVDTVDGDNTPVIQIRDIAVIGGWTAGFAENGIGIILVSWSDSKIVLGGFGTALGTNHAGRWSINPGDPILILVKVSGKFTSYETTVSGGWAPPVNGDAPAISSVSPISTDQLQTITIKGSNFGNTQPQTMSLGDGSVDTVGGGNTPVVYICDDGWNGWGAGVQDSPNSAWDLIGIKLVSWSDTEIVLGGFGSALSEYVLTAGDPMRVTVTTIYGTAQYTVNVGAGASTPSSTPTPPSSGGNGTSWSQDILLESNNASNDLPTSAVYQGQLFLIWQSNRDGNDQLYLKTYEGNTWSNTTRLTNDQAADGGPRLVVYNGLLYLFFHSTMDDPARDIYYMTFDGSSWSNPVRAVQNEGIDDFCGAAVYNGTLYLAWTSNRSGNFDIYYKTYDGSNWSGEVQLTTDPASDLHPALEAFEGKLFMEWHSDGYNASNWEIFYKTFDGTNWSDPIQLTTNPSINEGPGSLEVVGDSLYLSFSSSRDGNKQIYYDIFQYGQWCGEKRLTFSNATEWHSSLTFYGGKLYAFFESDREGNSQLYYKTLDITPAYDNGENENVFSVNSNSTVNDLTFDSANQEISFTVSGPHGTTGFASVNISKTLMPDVSNLTVNLDGTPINYTITSGDNFWLIYLTYSHSTHVITLALNQAASEPLLQPSADILIICAVVISLEALFMILLYKARGNNNNTKQHQTSNIS